MTINTQTVLWGFVVGFALTTLIRGIAACSRRVSQGTRCVRCQEFTTNSSSSTKEPFCPRCYDEVFR